MMTIGGLHLSTSYLEDYQTNKKMVLLFFLHVQKQNDMSKTLKFKDTNIILITR